MELTTGTLLFYGGVAGLAVTLIATVIIIILQTKSRKRVRKKLDEEYGQRKV